MCWAGPAFHQEADSREGTRGEGGEEVRTQPEQPPSTGFPTTLFCFSFCENVLAHLRGINQMKPEPLQADGRKERRAPSSSLPPEKQEPLRPTGVTQQRGSGSQRPGQHRWRNQCCGLPAGSPEARSLSQGAQQLQPIRTGPRT